MLRHSVRRASSRAGYTLTEISIVLLIASVILGAVWAAAGAVSGSSGAYRAGKQVLEVAQNVREQYIGVRTPATWVTGGANLNVSLDALNLFPVEMRANPSLVPGDAAQLINHPMATLAGGSFRVFYDGTVATTTLSPKGPGTCSASVPCFRIWLYGLKTDACVKLVRALPIDDEQMGIAQLGITNTAGSCTGTTCVSTTQLSAATASSWCDGDGTTNTVFWDIKLHN